MNLLKNAKIIRVEASAVAGQTALDTDIIDMQGYESVCFIALLGDVTDTSVLGLTGKGNTANSTSSPTPVTYAGAASFTAGASNADGKMLVLDINRPRHRYVYASLTRTTANAVVDGIVAILYNGNLAPVTPDASIVASNSLFDPAAA